MFKIGDLIILYEQASTYWIVFTNTRMSLPSSSQLHVPLDHDKDVLYTDMFQEEDT